MHEGSPCRVALSALHAACWRALELDTLASIPQLIAPTALPSARRQYDHDRVFPTFGFGGTQRHGPVSHCFPLGSGPDGECAGVQGILAAYRRAWGGLGSPGPLGDCGHPPHGAAVG